VHIPDAPVEVLMRHKPPALYISLLLYLLLLLNLWMVVSLLLHLLYLPKSQTDTNPYIFLLSSMTFLQITPIICPGLMERMPILLLKNTSRGLKISLTFMRLKMTMYI
jgi:hypothetical protein